MSSSPYRNLYGEENENKRYNQMDLCKASTDGNKMAMNNKFMALIWNYDKGGIAIFDPNEYTYGKTSQKLLKGHKGRIFDIKFSPFYTDLLASASEDGSVKLWKIPEEGLKEHITEDVQMYTGHKRKVCLVSFHPYTDNVIASSSVDYTIQVWNMIKSEPYATCKIEGSPSSLEWNEDGSLVGTADSAKKVTIFDPRANKVIASHQVIEGRNAKFVWTGTETFTSFGLNKKNERELKLFDLRKLDNNELCKVKIDNQVGVLNYFYDHESKLLYLIGKGEVGINVFDFNEPTPERCLDLMTVNGTSCFCMMDRRYVNYNKNEVDKMARWSAKNEINYVSFTVMRRDEIYEPSLFPHLMGYESSMTNEEWFKGGNKEQIRKEIIEFKKTDFIKRDNNFEKMEAKKAELSPAEKFKKLENKLIELEYAIQKQEGINMNIEKLIQDEEKEVERLEQRLKEVLAEI